MKAEFNKQRMIEVSEPVASNPSGNGYVRFSQQRNTPNQQSSGGPDISNI
jgi:hypothetical protein